MADESPANNDPIDPAHLLGANVQAYRALLQEMFDARKGGDVYKEGIIARQLWDQFRVMVEWLDEISPVSVDDCRLWGKSPLQTFFRPVGRWPPMLFDEDGKLVG
jgi:hypothetical protein